MKSCAAPLCHWRLSICQTHHLWRFLMDRTACHWCLAQRTWRVWAGNLRHYASWPVLFKMNWMQSRRVCFTGLLISKRYTSYGFSNWEFAWQRVSLLAVALSCWCSFSAGSIEEWYDHRIFERSVRWGPNLFCKVFFCSFVCLLMTVHEFMWLVVFLSVMCLQAKSIHHMATSLMAIITVVKTLGSKRATKALESKSPLPAVLIKSLNETMNSCTELSLNIPGALQAKALQFLKPGKSD